MANFAYFVSEQDVKKNTPIDENVDSKLLQTAMRTAQDIQIRDAIGSGLYDELCDQINAGTLTANNTTLLNKYIAPCLYHYIIQEAMLPMTFKMMNKSIMTRGSDNSNSVDIDQLTRVERHYQNKAEYYRNRLTAYLCENQLLYPLYYNPGSGDDTIYPSDLSTLGGFFLGDRKKGDDPSDDKFYFFR